MLWAHWLLANLESIICYKIWAEENSFARNSLPKSEEVEARRWRQQKKLSLQPQSAANEDTATQASGLNNYLNAEFRKIDEASVNIEKKVSGNLASEVYKCSICKTSKRRHNMNQCQKCQRKVFLDDIVQTTNCRIAMIFPLQESLIVLPLARLPGISRYPMSNKGDASLVPRQQMIDSRFARSQCAHNIAQRTILCVEKKSIRLARLTNELKEPKVKRTMPALKMRSFMKSILVAVAWLAFTMSLFRWFAAFYFNICFDEFHKIHSLLDDYAEFWAIAALFVFYSVLYKWTINVDKRRLDLHHRAQSKGDMALLFGSAVFMAFKLILQVVELNLQRVDGFISTGECFIRSSALIMTHVSEWLQLFCLRRIIALHFEDIQECRVFLPSVAVSSVLVNWVSFAATFFETSLIKYQLGQPDYYFSQRTLISMIFTQTIYPADYLFTFTAAGCWSDVLVRYIELGYFQLGKVNSEENKEFCENEEYGADPERPSRQVCVQQVEQPKFSNLNVLYSQRRVHCNNTPRAITFTLPE